MKIEKIEKLKSGKYKITFDNKETFVTYDDVILKNNLLYHKEIENYLDLLNETSYFELYHSCIKYISKRLRSKKEIKEYLLKKEVEEKVVEKIMNELEEKGFLNDERFAKSYVQDAIYLSNHGPYKIRKELEEYGVEEAIIQNSMDIDEKEVLSKLEKIITKKINTNHKNSKNNLKAKILSSCIELGYEKSMIVSIFDKIFKKDDTIIYKEAEKIRKKLSLKYEKEEVNRILISKLYQKGFDMEDINKIKESLN